MAPKKSTSRKSASKKKPVAQGDGKVIPLRKKVSRARKKTVKKVPSQQANRPVRAAHKPGKEREFVDKMRGGERFFEIMEMDIEDPSDLERMFRPLLDEDPWYLEPYLVLHEAYIDELDEDYNGIWLEKAYERALDLVLDDQDFWPDRLEWGWLENRHILRTLHAKAELLWLKNEPTVALQLFHQIHKMNPNDNTGVRFSLLAILEGMDAEEYLDFSETEEGYMNPELFDWFAKRAGQYAHFFPQGSGGDLE
ncbi:MAG: hypothetical protein KDK39_10195 [Leptospiraceae bacterium]|nr:hypothetical protein [Leptospiraceae bacterium]